MSDPAPPPRPATRRFIAVIGSGSAGPDLVQHARDVGRTVVECGFGVVCGGLGGVMAGACEGAASASTGPGPVSMGILPGVSAGEANAWVQIAVPTGLGYARNLLVVLSATAVVAVGGESGTLSEIAHAWQLGKPVAGYLPAGGWGQQLAGKSLDCKRAGRIEPMADTAMLAGWLRSLSA